MSNRNKELLDIVNEQDEVVSTALREETDGNLDMIHRVVRCAIFNFDGQILLRRGIGRVPEKPGDQWSISCGGHVPTGEDPYNTMHRELEEELGLKDISITFVEKYIDRMDYQTEMVYLYFATIDESTRFELQKEEVIEVKWFDFDRALSMFVSKEADFRHYIHTMFPKVYQAVFSKNQRRAYWKLPNVIKKVGFDFRWDTKKVWALDLPVEEMAIEELTWHFEVPFWFNRGGFYDQKPIDVLNNPSHYTERIKRIKETDLTYPIDIMRNKDKWEILDGLHRLVHHKLLGHKTVKVRKIPKSMKSQIER